jgi:hypothetical protein
MDASEQDLMELLGRMPDAERVTLGPKLFKRLAKHCANRLPLTSDWDRVRDTLLGDGLTMFEFKGRYYYKAGYEPY